MFTFHRSDPRHAPLLIFDWGLMPQHLHLAQRWAVQFSLSCSQEPPAHWIFLSTAVWPRDGSSAMWLFEETLANQEIMERLDFPWRICSRRWDATLPLDLHAIRESRKTLLSKQLISRSANLRLLFLEPQGFRVSCIDILCHANRNKWLYVKPVRVILAEAMLIFTWVLL